ncbi:epoxide hydrolase [Nocardiopsis sp. CNT-189]|uniref:epoxide hydrolase family protein n=1 Tax=Nocardiopsis oceanisediminis TaxID=2816862 RepID=UPI003B3473B3
MSEAIEEFRVEVPQGDIDELHRRIDGCRWPDALPGAGWEYGVERDHLRELAEYWRDGFDWRAQEARLNALPQFRTGIDGQNVHFAHVRSPRPDAVPLLLTHGWPSTIADFLDIIGPLSDPGAHGAPDAPAFHVVAPSIPGFAFSGPTREKGWGPPRVARAWAELMRRLGYDRYIAQGGDAGSIISPELGRADTAHVLGVHLNALVGAGPDWESEDPMAGLAEEEAARVYAGAAEWEQRSGYAIMHSTRPQTIAYALNDSPVGMLAWNLEWFVDYDPARAVQTPVDRDAVLANASIFWFTGTSGSAARLYKESGDEFYGGPVSGVPTAVAVFPGDGALRVFAERSNRIVRWTEFDRGGHFASLQAPDLLVGDIRGFAAELLG